jgi:nicotinamidase-related amidase
MLTRSMETRSTAIPAAIVAIALLAASFSGPARAASIMDEWASIKAPAPPALKAVKIDPKTTALISMDFNQRNCIPAQRTRCADVLPTVQKLMATARAKGMTVVHTYTPNMKKEEIVQSVGPQGDEMVLQVRGDKFFGNALEKTLKDKGIKTVLLVGTSANGAVMFTAIGASQRHFKAIVPIDTMPADTAYQEQLAIFEISNGPGVREDSTLTRSDMLSF